MPLETQSRSFRQFLRSFILRIRGDVDFDSFSTTERPEPKSDLERIIYGGECRRLHKWIHYPAVYERLLAGYRGTDFRFLEIGVFGGGSLDMWRRYFGDEAVIHGVDINPDCAALSTPEMPVHVGSQDDTEFMRSVVAQMGGLDVVLDDGSHVGRHQIKSFEILWPLLAEGGLYIIEDVHTAYWRSFEGGYGKKGTAIDFAKTIIDDMHGWYHNHECETHAKTEVGSIQVFDSIIVIEKVAKSEPKHIEIKKTA